MASLPDPAAVAAAIMADVSGRMPTLAEMAATPAHDTDPSDMGPDVTLPALQMHLLMQHFRYVEANAARMALDLRIAQGTSIGLTPDDVGDARDVFAGHVAEIMVRSFLGDHDRAVTALIHAAAAILGTKYDGRFAARALEKGASIFADGLRNDSVPKGALQ